MDKSTVYTPSGVCPPGCEDWWENASRHDGLLVCGRPFDETVSKHTYAHADLDLEEATNTMPIGTPTFLEDFLGSYATKLEHLLAKLIQIPVYADPGEPAVQVACLILRHCATQKVAHLMRALPPAVTLTLARRVDNAVLKTPASITEIGTEEAERTRDQITMPANYGGIGLRPLEPIRHAAHLACWAQCAYSVAQALGPIHQPCRDWTNATLPTQLAAHAVANQIYEDYGFDPMRLVALTWEDFTRVETPKQQRPIVQAIWAAKYTRWTTTAPPRTLQTSMSASTVDNRPGAGDWLTAAPLDGTLSMADRAYQFAVRLRLGLPLAVDGDRCMVHSNSSSRTCGAPLTAMVDHAVGCARASRNRRHNAM